jgi:hypothetical protein
MLRRQPAPDDPTKLGEGFVAKEIAREKAIAAAKPGSALAKLGARNGERALSFENILKAHKIELGPKVVGFFLNSAMSIADGVGANTASCSHFPGRNPTHPAVGPDKFCIQLPPETVDLAKKLDGKRDLSEEEKADIAEILRVGVHEMEHAAFDTVQEDKRTQTIGGEKTCDLFTKIGRSTVEGLLSEIAAETSEYPVFYKNLAGLKDAKTALTDEESLVAFRGAESIAGAIQKLKTQCSAASVDSLVTQTIFEVVRDWPQNQKSAFFQAMTSLIHDDWPWMLRRTLISSRSKDG